MAIDELPGEIVTKTRDQCKADWLRSYRIRRPCDDVAPNTIPDAEAGIMADQLMVGYSNCKVIGENCTLRSATGTALEKEGYYEGVTRPKSVGSHGYVEVRTASGGSRIFAGDRLIEPTSRLQFYCTQGARYTDRQKVPIAGIDVGPATNLPAGTVLQWTAPRDGCSTNCTVAEQADGNGLVDGRDQAVDDEFRELIRLERANRARSGNDADIRKTVKETSNLQVQEVFTIPAARGPGTTGITFTLKPGRLGGSRCPTESQLREAHDYLRYKLPVDDGQFMLLIIPVDLDVQLKVKWASEAEGWVDATPWPWYSATHVIRIAASPAPTATTFRLESSSGVYTSCGVPVMGRTVAVPDEVGGRYVKKKIGVVSGSGPWDITADTTYAASDASFVPVVGSRIIPWSESLGSVLASIAAYFEKLGPGEQQSNFWDHGGRQRRYPFSPKYWPSEVSHRMLAPLFGLAQLQDIQAPYDLTISPPIGAPGVSLNMFELGEVALYPIT
jgi:uncharacterized phage protein gp47/JayE